MSWTAALAIVQTVGGFIQASQQADAAQAQAQAAAQSAQMAINEATRQQEENNRVAAEKKSDRIRALNEDIGRARVASAEGFGGLLREVGELGYVGGLDISRIESNRIAGNDALQARKAAAAQGAANAASAAGRTSEAAFTGAVLNGIGAGVRLGATEEANRRAEERGRNRNPGLVITDFP